MSSRSVLALVLAGASLLVAGCSPGGGGGSSTTTTAPPTPGACPVSIETEALPPRAPAVPKNAAAGDRQTRRGRVYQELWKHQAAAARAGTERLAPRAVVEDNGQIAVVRDQGDIILPANPYDLRSLSVAFGRTGVGTYDVRRSDRPFDGNVGERITIGDDESVSISLPFTVPFYSGRYNQVFLNSDGNLTFVTDDHASTNRDVSRFLTGPPRIALLFDDLDASAGGAVYRRVDSSALVVSWCNVPEFGQAGNRVNVQLRLGADGSIDFAYGTIVNATSAVVGVSPGSTGIFTPVDVSQASTATAPVPGGTGAVGERFAVQQELDFVALGRQFYRSHGDDFDQLVVFANTRTVESGTFAFEFTVANEVTGIGVDIYDTSRDFGSSGRLRSFVDMDFLGKYPDDPRQKFLGENNTLSVLGQECGHRWLAYMEFRSGTTNSSELLGRDEAHWSFFFDSDASNMEGNDIQDLGGGAFRTVGAVSQYCALDQYAMGLRLPSEVPPMFFVRSPSSGSPGDPPRIGVDIRGTRVDVRIEDIVAAMGARRPDANSAPKTVRAAFLYVVTGNPDVSADVAKLERIRSGWETYFNDSTGRRGTMNARLR